ncbi:MAG: hypothetical protein NW223_02735 [Hyphomicrobiaceae bacterium]|nr:hypothetical protein [Hyphomicrobiaceae bacterium]
MRNPVPTLCLRMAAAVAILLLAAVSARAEPPPPGRLVVEPAARSDGTVTMAWSGRVAGSMADQIRAVFEAERHRARRIVLKLNSGGGSVSEGERVIGLLREIRATHDLETVVEQGQICGSMCVFIYLQGARRVAALSSLWLFHEISYHDPKTNRILRLDRAAWERLVEKYYPAAGVSSAWIERMKPLTVASDYWQTGADLVRDQSGIVHATLSNRRERLIAERPPASPEAGREPPQQPPAPRAPVAPKAQEPEPAAPPPRYATTFETKACHTHLPDKQVYVNTPCG